MAIRPHGPQRAPCGSVAGSRNEPIGRIDVAPDSLLEVAEFLEHVLLVVRQGA
jgi:hypothetical protein